MTMQINGTFLVLAVPSISVIALAATTFIYLRRHSLDELKQDFALSAPLPAASTHSSNMGAQDVDHLPEKNPAKSVSLGAKVTRAPSSIQSPVCPTTPRRQPTEATA